MGAISGTSAAAHLAPERDKLLLDWKKVKDRAWERVRG